MQKRSFLTALRSGIYLIAALFLVALLAWYQGPRAAFFSLITFLEVIALFNILIIVHELGHFLAARWRGLKVEKFAIWMGKPLWSRKIDGVEYILGTIPAGGYVALPQMAPMESIEGKSDLPREELPPASPGDKIIVAFAGPLFSLGLAFVFATLIWIVGKPVSDTEKTTTIGYAQPDLPAYQAGVRPGDVLKSINGHEVHRWMGVPDGVIWRIITSTGGNIPVVVERDGKTVNFSITPAFDPKKVHHWYERSEIPRMGIAPAEKDIVIDKVLPNSPAAGAGLQKGDRLVALNGDPLYSTFPIYQQQLKDHPNDPIRLTVSRAGADQTVNLQPVRPISPADLPKDVPQTDIGILLADNVDIVIDHPSPWLQVVESANMVRSTVSALFASHSNVGASQLGGPLAIMNSFGAILSSEYGWRRALWFAVVINVNLAMLNLLPFPVLDGGHILLSIIEWVRRRPLSLSILEPLQTAFAVLLIGYMAFITFFDAQDSFKMATSTDTEYKFAPPASSP